MIIFLLFYIFFILVPRASYPRYQKGKMPWERGCIFCHTLTIQYRHNFLYIFFFTGIGVLGIPYAISVGGFLSIPMIIAYGILSNYTSKLIIECQYSKDKDVKIKVRSGYAAIGKCKEV